MPVPGSRIDRSGEVEVAGAEVELGAGAAVCRFRRLVSVMGARQLRAGEHLAVAGWSGLERVVLWLGCWFLA